MLTIEGTYNDAKVFADEIDDGAGEQIARLCSCPAFAGSKIRMMSDVHAGKGCCIGTTMTITDKVVPFMCGVDLNCGVLAMKLDADHIDGRLLDQIIEKKIPTGQNVHSQPVPLAHMMKNLLLSAKAPVDVDYALRSLGTLGGGNHFIEIDEDGNKNLWLVIHTGSRHLGLEIAEHYQKLAVKELRTIPEAERSALIERLKRENRQTEISAELKKLKQSRPDIPDDLAFVSGQVMADYLHDMDITRGFAWFNRCLIASIIKSELGIGSSTEFQTVHNYIDTKNMILRKGAVSAQKGEMLIIPINMHDGSLICVGKGNPDWNFSAPHGAGRILSRSQAKNLSMEDYRKAMEGIWTTCVCEQTLDESPMAYKSLESITSNIGDTVDIIERITPVYNYKAKD